jgi:hypothetical protein
MLVSFLRFLLNYLLNNGVKKTELSKVGLHVTESKGTYAFNSDAEIIVETKKVLTPREIRRKRLLIFFILSLVIMVIMQIVGNVLPDNYSAQGRTLILASEIPAFAFSLVSTRFFVKTRSRRKAAR